MGATTAHLCGVMVIAALLGGWPAAAAPTGRPQFGGLEVDNLREALAERFGNGPRHRRQVPVALDRLAYTESNAVLSFILQTNGSAAATAICGDAPDYGCSCKYQYQIVLVGAAVDCTIAALDAMLTDHSTGDVTAAEASLEAHIVATQTGATWGLDRIDQLGLPLNSQYTYDDAGPRAAGAGAKVFVIE